MRLNNTTPAQDDILSTCEDFGGTAAEAAEVAQDLDSQLTAAKERIKELEEESRL